MSMVRFAVGACAVVVTLGCGPAKPAPVGPLQQVSDGRGAVLALPELTPVAASPELFAVARIMNPARAADTAMAWSGLPLNWRAVLAKEAPGVDSGVAYDAPVDFAAMLDPSSGEEPTILWAVSYGAPSVDLAVSFLRRQGGTVTPDADGGYRVRVDSHVVCVAARALGRTPARVVCSDEAAGAQALAPYMTRGLSTESIGSVEAHIRIIAEPFRRRYGSQLALLRTVGVPFALRELEVDHPKFDRALRDVLYDLADEVTAFTYDFERVDFDVALAPGGDTVSLRTSLGLLGKRSWWAQMVAKAAEHPGVAPETFWRLPADATGGSFGTYSDPDGVRGAAAALRELLGGWLDYQGLSEIRSAALADAFEQVLTAGAKAAYVTLPVPPMAQPVGSTEREEMRVALGAHIFVVDHEGDRFVRLASEMVKALGDKSFRAHLSASKMLSGLKLPLARERPPKAVKGLPPGSKVFQLEIAASTFSKSIALAEPPSVPGQHAPQKPKKGTVHADAPLVIFLVAVPDGPLTWLGFGTDEKLLETRLAAARAGSGETLARREGLSPLRSTPGLSAGFSSLAAVVSRFGASHLFDGKSLSDPQTLGRLPHRGETPMLWRVIADAKGPQGVFELRVPRAVVEDVVALATSHVLAGGNSWMPRSPLP